MYISNKRAQITQKLAELKSKIDKFTVMTGGLNVAFATTDKTTRQKISKAIYDLNNTTSQ